MLKNHQFFLKNFGHENSNPWYNKSMEEEKFGIKNDR